jgi:hypothetical protein
MGMESVKARRNSALPLPMPIGLACGTLNFTVRDDKVLNGHHQSNARHVLLIESDLISRGKKNRGTVAFVP